MKLLPKAVDLALLLLVLGAGSAHAAGAKIPEIVPNTNSVAAVVATRKSSFDPEAAGARDPFYPDAVRSTKQPVIDDRENSVTAFSKLTLGGIISGRSALINGRNFVPGDEANVRLPGGRQVKVKVIQVHEDSVTITLGGQAEQRTLYAKGAGR